MLSLQSLHPNRWSLFVRTQVLVALMVALLAVGFAWVLIDLQQLVERNRQQLDRIGQQQQTLAHQNDVVQAQKAQLAQQHSTLDDQLNALAIQQQASVVLQLYPEFLFWRFASTASQSNTDIGEGDRSETELREAVAVLSDLDADLGEAMDVFLLDLDSFNKRIGDAIAAFRSGDDAGGRRLVQTTQTPFISMNTMVEVVADMANESVVAANDRVADALSELEATVLDVEQAAASVAEVGTNLSVDIEAVVDQANATGVQGWMTLAVIGVLFIGVGWVLARSVSGPVLQLQRSIKRIDETANLSERVHLKRRDEVGLIAQSVNAMLQSFGDIIRDVRSGAATMSDRVGDNSRANEEVGRILDRLNDEVEQVAAAINELSATVRGINQSTSEAAERASQAEQECRHGAERSRASGEQEARLQEEIGTAAGNLNRLAERASDIQAVIDVIQEVSEQTNLLALNAAIEAARAGEYGRGFAVVAEEVRTLAQKTENSSAEIKTMIEQFAAEVGTTVQAMDQAVQSAQAAGELSEEASVVMDGVFAIVAEIRATNEHISQATQEQSEATDSIDGSVTSIASLIAQVAEQAQHTVAGVHDIAEQSNRLRQQTERFTV
ncbi:methyl-accepting chemotaxis protein [Saccharospirillum mangrovi]|uniref:methyl-accepting chemotaxis protein n=1 Tax=Saccharospirillum mangrovi TaxID=2161747 RepID=UPI000D33B66D|nr:methyl-accepting chemotaxis protein [Saccharospirillum mangrovi]